MLNQIRGELTLHEQLVVLPLLVETPEPPPRAAKPLPPHLAALVTQLNANPSIVTDEDLDRLQIRVTDRYSRIRLPDLLPLVELAIVEQAQAAFPDAPASQAVLLRWHLRGLSLGCEQVLSAALSNPTRGVDGTRPAGDLLGCSGYYTNTNVEHYILMTDTAKSKKGASNEAGQI